MPSAKILGLMMIYAEYMVEAPLTPLNSEFSSKSHFNNYNSRALNSGRKLAEHSTYFGSLREFGQRHKSYKGYNFDYKVTDVQGNTHYHKADADDKGTVKGTYGYTDIHGLYRIVAYTADANGFYAKIETNEPGTVGKSPASVERIAELPPAVSYAEPVRIHQGQKIFGQSQYEQGSDTIHKGDKPSVEKYAPRTMVAAVHQGFSSSHSVTISDEEEE